jgi:F0F1-type ATP synthase membrane subunit c/vacuolar-type H+-ATPase subunit K
MALVSGGDMEKWLLSVTLAALVASTAAANATDSICEAVAMKATTKPTTFLIRLNVAKPSMLLRSIT